MNLRKKLNIAEFLRTVVKQIDSDTLGYDEGWTDGRVSRELGVSTQAVVAVRKAMFPNWTKTEKDDLKERISRLEQKIEIIMSHIRNESNTSKNSGEESFPPRIPRWDENDWRG